MRRSLWSIWSWAALGAIVIVWTPIVAIVRLLTAPFDRARYATGYTFRRLCVLHQKLTPLWTFKTSGRMPANKRNPFVVVANHESFVDMLLISHLPFEMKWMSKKSLFNIPLVGWMMHMSGDIKLVRGNRESGRAALDTCREWLNRKVSVMIFPEGSRSPDGKLKAFKDGAFRLAIETGTPILPLVVNGTRSALRKHDWRLGDSRAEVRVLEPIDVTGLTEEDIPELRERVRDIIANELEEMRSAA